MGMYQPIGTKNQKTFASLKLTKKVRKSLLQYLTRDKKAFGSRVLLPSCERQQSCRSAGERRDAWQPTTARLPKGETRGIKRMLKVKATLESGPTPLHASASEPVTHTHRLWQSHPLSHLKRNEIVKLSQVF